MQVQHEVTLIESLSLKCQDFVSTNLQTRSSDAYALNQNPLRSIDHIASSPAHNLIAVHISGSNHIVIYDTKSRTRRDRFPLKSCDKRYSKQSFSVSGVDFSPDGSRLAVGQTDCIIYVYKLPNYSQQQPYQNPPTGVSSLAMPLNEPIALNPSAAGPQSGPSTLAKPIITGKFASSSPVSCLKWSEWGIVFGCQDGKIKMIVLASTNVRQQQQPPPQQQQQQIQQQQQPQSIENIPAKVISIYTAAKDIVPMSLACKASILAISFIDNSTRIVCLNLDTAMQDYQQIGLGGELTGGGGRRSSFIVQQYQSFLAQASESQNFSLATTIEHTCPASCVVLMQSATMLCLAGSDGRISLSSVKIESVKKESGSNYGSLINGAQHSLVVTKLRPLELKEDIVALDYSSVNEIMAIATKSKLLFLKLDQATNSWQLERSHIECRNLFAITSVAWSRDGSYLFTGTWNGSLELFRCSWIKHSINDQLDICLIAKNRVRITDNARNLLATYKTPHEIKRVNLLDNGQSVIVWTSSSLLLARMDLQLQSEFTWSYGTCDKLARFTFTDALGYVLIYRHESNEIFVVKLGFDSIVFSTHAMPNRATVCLRSFPPPLLSSNDSTSANLRLSPGQKTSGTPLAQQVDNPADEIIGNESPVIKLDEAHNEETTSRKSVEVLAYVCEQQQLRLVDLKNKSELKFHDHDQSIVSLKLSHTGGYLSLLDASGRLYLVQDVARLLESSESDARIEAKFELLVKRGCTFASWPNGTDVLVAQSESKILVWYDLRWRRHKPEKIDTKKLNINNEAPLLDLGLVELSDSSEDKSRSYPKIVRLSGSELSLSNGQRIQLDAIRVNFSKELANNQLDKALELLDRTDNLILSRGLLQTLGWSALEQFNTQVAMLAFERVGASNICEFIRKCSTEMTSEQSAIKIAMLCGHWDKFEQLNEGGHLETVVSTYKRLNKWTRLIDYLTRTQQVRQRDMAEKEFQDWLISRNRHLEAAKVCARSSCGDVLGALNLLMKHGKYYEACDFVLNEHQKYQNKRWPQPSNFKNLIADLVTQLIQSGQVSRAAKLSEKILGNPTKALDLYAQANEFECALRLANSIEVDANKVIEIKRSYAHHLLDASKRAQTPEQSRRLTLKAVEHLVAAGERAEALRLATGLGEFDVAYNILIQLSGASLLAPQPATMDKSYNGHEQEQEQHESSLEQFSEQCKQVAEHMRRSGRLDEALRAYRAAGGKGCVGQVVELELERGNVDAAYRSALDDLYEGNRTKVELEFGRYAKSIVERAIVEDDHENTDAALKKAERIYLQLERVDLAIEAYERAERYDKMLQLIAEHQSDQLEGALLQLARRMEARGEFEDAERYLLRASDAEWTNVVRMYRLANKWPDAYRVAREHCASESDPLLVQLAYWWAKSIAVGADTGSNGDGNGAAAAAAEALLARGETNERRGEPASCSIEKARQLLEQLRVLVQVVEFSCENKNFQLAIDLSKGIESLQRDCVRRYATYLEQQHKFDRAEQVLLEHNLVELAARMYLDNGKHTDAVRVVEQRMHNETHSSDLAANNGRSSSSSSLAKLNEILIECAERISDEVAPVASAATLTLARARSQANERLASAQQIFLRAQRPDLAVEMYVRRGLWQDAMQVAQRFAPRLVENVERALDEQMGDDMDSIIASVAPSKTSPMVAQKSQVVRETEPSQALSSAPVDSAPTSTNPIEAQRRQVEAAAQSGDRRATRQAFASLVDTLTSDLATLSSDQLDDRLAHLEWALELKCGPDDISAKVVAPKGAHLFEWLFLQRATGDTKQLDENPSWQRLVLACDFVFCNCEWGTLLALGPVADIDTKMSIWHRLRNILELCIGWLGAVLSQEQFAQVRPFGSMIARNGFELDPNIVLVAQLERRLLVAHFVVLMNSLACILVLPEGSTGGVRMRRDRSTGAIAQMEHLLASIIARYSGTQASSSPKGDKIGSLIGLAFKLSHALLSYTDLIETRAALLQASLWSIALRRNDLAQASLKRALELEAQLAASGASRAEDTHISSSAHAELNGLVADLPEPRKLKLSRTMHVVSMLQSEARQWLLESTIGVGSKWSAEVESHPIVAAASAATSAKVTNGSKQTLSGVCLLSGSRIEPSQVSSKEVRLLGQARTGAQCFATERDWLLLVDLRSWTQAQPSLSQRQRQQLRRRSPESMAASTGMQMAFGRLSDVADFLGRLIGHDAN